MKLFLFLIGMVAAGILGYSFEPEMRYQLTGMVPGEKKAVTPKRITVETGAPAKAVDPASFSAEQLPEKILLKADAEVADTASDLKMTITAGNRVNLIRLEGQNVVISPGTSPFQGTIPISQTDLLEQLAALPKGSPAPDMAAVEEVPVETPEATAPAPEMDEEPVAEPMPEEPAVPDGPVDVVAVMQESIKSGQIKEFTFDQVLEWQPATEPENVDGESYQTGIASYKAETVFGVKTIQAKALIKGGKVVRWLWPKSGMEIK